MTKKISTKKLSAMLVALLFVATSSVAMATNISGVSGSGGVFNIDPTNKVDGMGFRSYENFQLSKGDTANLKFNGISKFVNMVDNQININGLVQTVDGSGAFTNGHAVFMSPNGMVVGADGVMNVGALSVYTPTAPGMKMLKDGVNAGNLVVTDGKYKGVNLMEAMGWHGNAPITIEGKVFSAGDVTMVANQFNIAQNGGVAAGAVMPADQLFSSLVKTNNTANVDIRSYNRNGNGGVNINGNLVNMGNGNIEVINRGTSGLNVNGGNVLTSNGQLHLVNYKGTLNVDGNVTAAGDNIYLTNASTADKLLVTGDAKVVGQNGIKVHNRSSKGIEITGEMTNLGKDPNNKGFAITNEAGVMNISGKVKNSNANMNITSRGSKLIIGDTLENSGGKLTISGKGADGMEINGTIKNAGNTAITNYNGAMTVNGTVQNTSGKMNLTNKGAGGLKLASGSKIIGAGNQVLIQNTGAGGFKAEGTIESSANTFLQNTNGDMNIDNKVAVNGKVLYIGNLKNGNGELAINGDITNTDGEIQIYNTGTKGLNVNGNVHSTGANTYIHNRTGNLKVADGAKVETTDGSLYLTNAGNALNISEDADLVTEGNKTKLQILNKGNGGLNMDGTVTHSTSDRRTVPLS